MKRVLIGSTLALWMLLGLQSPVHAGGIHLYDECTLDDPTGAKLHAARHMVNQQCPCSAATDHISYVACARNVASQAVAAGTLPQSCGSAVTVCALKTTCGRKSVTFGRTSVTCCITDRFGHPGCRMASSAHTCTRMRGTPSTHTPTPCASCCDACPNPGSGPSCSAN